jgi:WD40 repeat protein
MVEKCILTEVNPTQLIFTPGENSVGFEVSVRNDSPRYASFQLAIIADYEKSPSPHAWYRISPEVSTKKPPGASTTFWVEIFDTPVSSFVGLMQLKVKVSSIELPDIDTVLLRLTIKEGKLLRPVVVELREHQYRAYPGDFLSINVSVFNPNQQVANVRLKMLGLNPAWFDISQYNLSLRPNETLERSFSLQLPDPIQIQARDYLFKVEGMNADNLPAYIEGILSVLPKGNLEFSCQPNQQQIPQPLSWRKRQFWAFWRSHPVTYTLEFNNQSNLFQQVSAEITEQSKSPCIFNLIPLETVVNPGDSAFISLQAQCQRHWFGSVKTIRSKVNALWSSGDELSTRNETQLIELLVKPIIPLWLSFAGVLFFLWLLWWFFFNPPTRHKEAVNSVQFNGLGENIVSGSNDQTIIRWSIHGFNSLIPIRPKVDIDNTNKAVRVVRYRPVDNNWVAAGLENGEIQLWKLLSDSPSPAKSFHYQLDDRVLALEFSHNANHLFSGHGSGLLLQWNLMEIFADNNIPPRVEPRVKDLGFAIYGLELLGEEGNHLVVAGRYNRLMVWDWVNDRLREISYEPKGGQNDYIETLDTAFWTPGRLVTADNSGYITIWDLQDCLSDENQPCGRIVDQWSDGHDGQSVRAVALSEDGCYLVSGGDDGKVKLWYLTLSGERIPGFEAGKAIAQSLNQEKFYGVDVTVVKNQILIASGSGDTWVRVAREKRPRTLGCDRY